MSELNKVKKLSDDLYVITETDSVHCYLIIGSEKAVVFDIGYGYEDIKPLIREITDLPIMLVLSHGDPDHGLGSSHFDEIWIHELDYGKLLWNDNSELRTKAVEYRINKMPSLGKVINKEEFIETRILNKVTPHFLQDNDVIDLGNKKLEVIHTPGHSYGHIMLLDKENKRLFSGDQVTGHNIWYFATSDHQAPFSTALNSLKKIMKYKEEIKDIFPAHGKSPIDITYVEDQIECLERELIDNYKNDKEFRSFMGNGYQHFYKSVNLIYSDDRLSEYIGRKIKR